MAATSSALVGAKSLDMENAINLALHTRSDVSSFLLAGLAGGQRTSRLAFSFSRMPGVDKELIVAPVNRSPTQKYNCLDRVSWIRTETSF